MKLLIATLTLTILVLPAFSQSRGKTTVRFTAFPDQPDALELEVNTGKGKTIPIELPSHVVSEEYRISRRAVWQLGKTSTNDKGEEIFEAYGSVVPANALKQLIVVIFTGETPEDGFKFLAIDDKNFGKEELMILNSFTNEVAVSIGDDEFNLKPDEHRILTPKPKAREKFYHANLSVLHGDTWKTFYEANWPLYDKSRGLVFLHAKKNKKAPTLHSVVDNL